MCIKLTEAKRKKYKNAVDNILRERRFFISELSRLVGRLTFTKVCCGTTALIRVRELCIAAQGLKRSKNPRATRGCLSEAAIADLQWWSRKLETIPSCPIRPPRSATIRVESDASDEAAGAIVFRGPALARSWSRQWTKDELKMSINARESLAAMEAIMAMLQTEDSAVILLTTDNISARKWVAKSGTRAPKQVRALARAFGDWLDQHKHKLIVRYQPGPLNWQADRISRPRSFQVGHFIPTEVLLAASWRWGAVEEDLSEQQLEPLTEELRGRRLLLCPKLQAPRQIHTETGRDRTQHRDPTSTSGQRSHVSNGQGPQQPPAHTQEDRPEVSRGQREQRGVPAGVACPLMEQMEDTAGRILDRDLRAAGVNIGRISTASAATRRDRDIHVDRTVQSRVNTALCLVKYSQAVKDDIARETTAYLTYARGARERPSLPPALEKLWVVISLHGDLLWNYMMIEGQYCAGARVSTKFSRICKGLGAIGQPRGLHAEDQDVIRAIAKAASSTRGALERKQGRALPIEWRWIERSIRSYERCKHTPHLVQAVTIALLAFTTVSRLGEVLALRREDVLQVDGAIVLRFRTTKTRQNVLKAVPRTKTETCPTRWLVEHLKSVRDGPLWRESVADGKPIARAPGRDPGEEVGGDRRSPRAVTPGHFWPFIQKGRRSRTRQKRNTIDNNSSVRYLEVE
ncbi:hypothetical protein J8273_5923 [Carpediemonas membranifera]|uniref:Uncharacterized protein n=1 Tax=Carpediemonas membranifera TaxID=201153 RepID=A0A8J6B2D4_9EUKA|nr:hypothetical protein J8273_5923 [Carpediemonas membranifera]|eukprot:KAG9392779.1 hypothetical protein J8273_5923 [Carpediemonas membranifera]